MNLYKNPTTIFIAPHRGLRTQPCILNTLYKRPVQHPQQTVPSLFASENRNLTIVLSNLYHLRATVIFR